MGKSVSGLPVLAAAAALTMAVAKDAAAQGVICPQYLTAYCVTAKAGLPHTAQTNPCFAEQKGLRVLHIGACLGPICSQIYDPVCSIDPTTGKQKTYSSLCLSDVADARLVHKGKCRHH